MLVCLSVSQSVYQSVRRSVGRLAVCGIIKLTKGDPFGIAKYTCEATYERINDKERAYYIVCQKASGSYLNFSVDGVKLKLIAKQAEANLVFLHPLIGIVSTLRCTSNNLCDRTKIYLQPLEHVVISR